MINIDLLAMGIVLGIILFVFACHVILLKKYEIVNDEQANETESLKKFQAMPEIEEGGQRGNVTFKQKRPLFQGVADRPRAAPEPRGPL